MCVGRRLGMHVRGYAMYVGTCVCDGVLVCMYVGMVCMRVHVYVMVSWYVCRWVWCVCGCMCVCWCLGMYVRGYGVYVGACVCVMVSWYVCT